MILKKLEVNNFQSHKKTVLSFTNGFTCITGPSQSGKSSIFRALDFLFYNIWKEEYITFGQEEVKLVAHFDNFTMERRKGEKVNKVTISFTVPGSKDITFENFGTEYPDEIKQILGISEIVVNDKSLPLNTANQDNPLFVLYESGIFKSKLFGHISKTQIVDTVVGSLNQDKKSITKQLALLESSVQKSESKLEEYNSYLSKRKELQEAKQKLVDLRKLEDKVSTLRQFKDKLSKYKSIVEQFKKKSEYVSTFDESKYTKIIGCQDRLQKLNDIKRRFTKILADVSKLDFQESLLNTKYSEVEAEISKIKVCPTCGNPVS